MKKELLVDDYCEGCIYLIRLAGTGESKTPACNYYISTGKRRPCPPGKGCTVKIEGEKEKVGICFKKLR